jgi:NAD kinase
MKIAILGGSFNPAGTHHLRIVEEVLKLNCFDTIVILPCGPRPDKQSVGDIEAVYRAAMLDITRIDGEHKSVFGFNEVWVERETGQSAWLDVIWNNENRISKVVGDGLIVSTAAGSTGYAQNICGYSLPTHVRELLLVGMAVSEPQGWRNAIFPQTSMFEIRSLDNNKRSVRAFVDGIPQGKIDSITIKDSKIASVELAFIRGFDIAAKHTKIQLPYFQTFKSDD